MLSLENSRWSNWSNSFSCYPKNIHFPHTEEEIASLLKTSDDKVRIVGSGHSFSEIVKTNNILFSLDNMQGLIEVDFQSNEVEVWAGTKLYHLNKILDQLGLSMSNLGDIDKQSVAGALCSGTHGTGLAFGVLTNFIVSFTIIDAKGDIIKIDCNSINYNLLKLNLGVIGIVTRVRLKVEPKYKLEEVVKKVTLSECLKNLDSLINNNRHFEFFWFPYSHEVSVKLLNKTILPIREKSSLKKRADYYLENNVFNLISDFAKNQNKLSPYISKLCSRLMSESQRIDSSFKIFASDRDVKFQEMEYGIAIEDCPVVLEELDKMIRENQIKVHFPVEVRFCAADELSLSPCYKRETCFIAIHMYQGMDYKIYFSLFEELMKKYNGRPHWGKMSFLSRSDFMAVYPQFEKFNEIRKKFDTSDRFLNERLGAIFGC